MYSQILGVEGEKKKEDESIFHFIRALMNYSFSVIMGEKKQQ